MKKVYRKLTQEQKDRGVIFSSQLQPNGYMHEVLGDDERAYEKIANLKDDSFFNKSPYTSNEIRT